MSINCANITSKEYNKLKAKFGEDKANYLWNKLNGTIPEDISKLIPIEFKKAQVLMPHTLVKTLAENGIDVYKLTHEELQKVVSPEVLEGLSYRIPNQAAASNDAFEIVGILPENAGDTIIAFKEITTKTGSDFDIDKAFIMLPNYYYDKETKRLEIYKDDSKEGLENKRLSIASQMLSTIPNYIKLMKPLDTKWLENLVFGTKEKVGLFNNDKKAQDLDFFTGINQVKTKSTFDNGKALVGPIAKTMTNHNAVKHEGIKWSKWFIGKGIFEETTEETIIEETAPTNILNENGTIVNRFAEEVDAKYELFPGVFANQGQREALDKITEFLDSSEPEFLLMGKGGTGKTTIIKKILDKLPKEKVIGIAPSHKAKKVLAKSINTKDKTYKTTTLASALAIKLNENTGTFEPDEYARKKGSIPIKRFKYIVLDESSMVSDALLDEIKKFMMPTAKIIYMGDKAQLPPVGQLTDSKVFDILEKYELTEKMRQAKTSPIINIGTKIAENVETTDENRKPNVIDNSDRQNVFDEESGSSILFEKDLNKALNNFVKDFNENPTDVNHVKIVTFNNQNHNSFQSVKNLNNQVREKLFGDKISTQFLPGELVTSYGSYSIDSGQDVDETIIQNSEDFIVDSARETSVADTAYAYSAAKGRRGFNYNYNIVALTLKNDEGVVIEHDIPVIANSSKEQYRKDLAALWINDKALAFSLQNEFADIEYGYAITSHKAQGSTYNTVYVMEDNILGPSNGGSIKSKNQSLYVAVSRPKNKLVMVSENNPATQQLKVLPKQELNQKTFVTNAIKDELPIEISDSITVVEEVPLDILDRSDLFLSLKEILNDNNINDEILINWAGVNKDKIDIRNIKSEKQLTNLIEKVYDKNKNPNNHPELKNSKLILESFNNWVSALERFPVPFRERMLSHAVKYLNPQRRSKYVLQLSEVALSQAYGIVVNKPHELNRIGKLYDSEVLKTVSDAVGHEPSASGKGHWVHIPRTASGKVSGYNSYDKFKEDTLERIEDLTKYIEEAEKVKNKELTFEAQENYVNKEDRNKYGFQDYQFVRTESTYSRWNKGTKPSLILRNQPHIEELGENYEGYYIHGYNTNNSKNKKKILPITKEEAKKIWEQNISESDLSYTGYEPGDRQLLLNLKGNIKRREELREDLKKIKEEDFNVGVQHKVNVELLRKLSPSTWCTASGMASHYVENYDNYLLIIDGVTVAGIEAGDKGSNGKIQVKEVTSRGNNGVASIDHIDDIVSFFEKHNLDTNNNTLSRALKAKEQGKEDSNMFDEYEPDPEDGYYGFEPDDFYPDYGEYYADEQEREREIEIARDIISDVNTIDEALTLVGVNPHFLDNYFYEFDQNLRNDERLATMAVNAQSHNIRHIDSNNSFYEKLMESAVNRNPYVFNYLPNDIKEKREDLKKLYDAWQAERDLVLDEELPFSKTNNKKIQGYYDAKNDKVVVVANNVSVNEASKVAIHEVAHRGMVRMAKELGGTEELNQVLLSAEKQLMKALPDLLKRTGHKNVEDLAMDYGFDVNSKDGKYKLLNELAARWAETLVNKPKPSWWKEFITSIKNWLTKFTGKTLNEQEVNELVGGFVKYGTKQEDKTNTSNPKDFINYSGAAKGSDTHWAIIGKEYGIGKQVDFVANTYDKLSDVQKEEIEIAYKKAVKELNRKELDLNDPDPKKAYGAKLVRRDYLQAKAADSIFAIIEGFDKDNLPKGGTAYASMMAVEMKKPVHIFNQEDKTWYEAKYTEDGNFYGFEQSGSIPKLTPKFAGIGTRKINEAGEQAIKDVYENTFNNNKTNIYNQLGNKTKSEHVIIKSWGELKDATTAITPEGIVSTRIKNTEEHFGNPFSHDPAGKAQGLIKTETIKEAVEKYTDWVINSKDNRANWIREQLKSGKLKGQPILYYKELGEPSHATALDYLINKYNWNNTESQKNNYTWSRYSENNYEVSSAGDKRFSALYAKLKDGRTIEEAYQLDIKGYRSQGNDWKLGKGKPPINNITKEDQWNQYKNLWKQYLNENPDLEKDLREKANGKVLTDKFASTDVSQARALSELLNSTSTESQKIAVGQPTISPTDKIIWGHPAIGKTFAAKKANMIDFDSYKLGINKKYNLYITPGLSDTELRQDDKTREAREKWRYEKPENGELWNQFIRESWQQAKKDAKEKGAILFASDLLVLREFGGEIDKALNMSDELFFERSKQRNNFTEGELGTEAWKKNLNKAVDNFKSEFGDNKVINTNKYLSDLIPNTQQPAQQSNTRTITTNKKESLVSTEKDEKGNDIEETLTGYMNAIVDMVKNPEVINQSNLNLYTASTAFLLARAGVDRDWTTVFLKQPILVDLVNQMNISESRISQKLKGSDGETLKALDIILKKYGSTKSGREFKEGILKDNLRNEDGFVTITEAELRKEFVNPNNEIQIKVLKQFLEYQTKGFTLADLMTVMSADTDGATKNGTTADMRDNLMMDVIAGNEFTDLPSLLGYDLDENNKPIFNDTRYIGTYHKNSVQLLQKIAKQKFISSSDSFKHAVNTIARYSGHKKLKTKNDEELVKNIENELFAGFIEEAKIVSFNDIEDLKTLLYGNKSKISKILEQKEKDLRELAAYKKQEGSQLTSSDVNYFNKVYDDKIKSLPKNKTLAERVLDAQIEHPDNLFLAALLPNQNVYNNGKPSTVSLSSKNIDKESKDDLYLYWEDLLNIDKQLAEDLIKYSYYSSGFSPNLGVFFEHIPTSWVIENKLNDYIKGKLTTLNESNMGLLHLKDQVVRHSYKNNSIVPTISDKMLTEFKMGDGGIVPSLYYAVIQDFNASNLEIGENKHGQKEYKTFIKRIYTEPNTNETFTYLYQYKGYGLNKNSESKEIKHLLYERVSPLGTTKGINVIKEYGNNGESIFSENKVNIPPYYKDYVDKLKLTEPLPIELLHDSFDKKDNTNEEPNENDLMYCNIKIN